MSYRTIDWYLLICAFTTITSNMNSTNMTILTVISMIPLIIIYSMGIIKDVPVHIWLTSRRDPLASDRIHRSNIIKGNLGG